MTRWEGEHCWAWGENLLLRHLSVFAASQLPVPGDILAKTKAFTIFALCVTISLIHIDFVSSASSKRFRCNFVLLYIEYVTNYLLFPKVILHSLFYLRHLDCQNAPYNKFLSPCLLFLCIPIRPYIPKCPKKVLHKLSWQLFLQNHPFPTTSSTYPSRSTSFLDLVVSIFYPHRINCQKQLCSVTRPPRPPQHPVLYQQLLAWIGSLSSVKPGSPAENLNGKLRHKKLPGSWIGNIIILIISF